LEESKEGFIQEERWNLNFKEKEIRRFNFGESK